MNIDTNAIWIAVRCERGFITNAEVFLSRQAAEGCEAQWRSAANPDYDESAVFYRKLPHNTLSVEREAT
jgi:hypothetical protein